MPTWKKVVVSGSQAHLIVVTASIHNAIPNAIGFIGTSSWAASASFVTASNVWGPFGTSSVASASHAVTAAFALNVSTPTLVTSASVVQIFDQSAAATTQYITFASSTSGYPSRSIDTNLTYLPSTDTLTLGNIAVNSGSITTTSSSFNIATTNATTITIGGAASLVSIPGNLLVDGTTTFINTTNLLVEDKFILLNSGSATGDGGIIIQEAADFSGSAFFWSDTGNRWSVQTGVGSSATLPTTNSFVVTVSGSTVDPTGNPFYGSSDSNRIGNMYVNTLTQDIWIWS